MSQPKIYLAAPFFNDVQRAFVTELEAAISDAKFELFSPRYGENAKEMNRIIGEKGKPSLELRNKVFIDNWENIDDADLLVAVIDDFDVGVMWEVGYAFARHVPIITITNRNYGCNLMLAQSTIGHLKTVESLKDVLAIANPRIAFSSTDLDAYGAAIAEIQSKYKSDFALKEGPDERKQ